MRRWLIAFSLVLGCGRPAPAPSAVSPAVVAAPSASAGDAGACCSAEDMRADLHALQGFIESSHPDPYGHAGGVEAFRARFAEVERGLPETLEPRAFYRLLRPLVAQVRDGHTTLRAPATPNEMHVRVALDVIEERLVVRGVYDPAARDAIGAVVRSVEGVPVATLAERMASLRGYENVYGNLRHLADALTRASMLEDLVGRAPGEQVRFELTAGSSQRLVDFRLAATSTEALLEAPTKRALPETDATGIGAGFLGADGATAVLRIDSSMKYREAFEVWRATGFVGNLSEHLDEVFRAATGKPPTPEMTLDDRIKAIPSFTERLEKLFAEMKTRKTSLLLVDLRENEGGNSVFAMILEYFLYPVDAIVAADRGYQVPRYGALYFSNHTTDTLEKVRARTRPNFNLGDSDTKAEDEWKATHGKPPSPAALARGRAELMAEAKMIPSFDRALATGTWNASWKPKVVVLTSARTYSAGFDAVLALRAHGAKVAGVPPAQAANCFIDSLGFTLPRSHFTGSISYKRSLRLPADPPQGELLHPDLELTYIDFAKRAFDPNAAYDLVLANAAAR